MSGKHGDLNFLPPPSFLAPSLGTTLSPFLLPLSSPHAEFQSGRHLKREHCADPSYTCTVVVRVVRVGEHSENGLQNFCISTLRKSFDCVEGENGSMRETERANACVGALVPDFSFPPT